MSVVPSQILYLEHGSSRLYAEAIQIVSNRQVCWARPTLLIQNLPEKGTPTVRQAVIAEAAASFDSSSLQLYDLEGAPDLIWPIDPFNIAYDLDFFSLIVQIKMLPERDAQQSRRQLNQFIRSFWHEHSETFHFTPASERYS
ncbi:MAG: hypothetical protein AAFY54_11740 [Cyanobacteria bacterium J06648_10]